MPGWRPGGRGQPGAPGTGRRHRGGSRGWGIAGPRACWTVWVLSRVGWPGPGGSEWAGQSLACFKGNPLAAARRTDWRGRRARGAAMRLGWSSLWELGMIGPHRWGCRWRPRGVLEVRPADLVGGAGAPPELSASCSSEHLPPRGDSQARPPCSRRPPALPRKTTQLASSRSLPHAEGRTVPKGPRAGAEDAVRKLRQANPSTMAGAVGTVGGSPGLGRPPWIWEVPPYLLGSGPGRGRRTGTQAQSTGALGGETRIPACPGRRWCIHAGPSPVQGVSGLLQGPSLPHGL